MFPKYTPQQRSRPPTKKTKEDTARTEAGVDDRSAPVHPTNDLSRDTIGIASGGVYIIGPPMNPGPRGNCVQTDVGTDEPGNNRRHRDPRLLYRESVEESVQGVFRGRVTAAKRCSGYAGETRKHCDTTSGLPESRDDRLSENRVSGEVYPEQTLEIRWVEFGNASPLAQTGIRYEKVEAVVEGKRGSGVPPQLFDTGRHVERQHCNFGAAQRPRTRG